MYVYIYIYTYMQIHVWQRSVEYGWDPHGDLFGPVTLSADPDSHAG